MTYLAADTRYDSMPYRRVGRSGLKLPAISLGLWHNFGDDKPFEIQRAILRRAFDLGVTHFDLANNYGPPYGSAETTRYVSQRLGPAKIGGFVRRPVVLATVGVRLRARSCMPVT